MFNYSIVWLPDLIQKKPAMHPGLSSEGIAFSHWIEPIDNSVTANVALTLGAGVLDRSCPKATDFWNKVKHGILFVLHIIFP